MVFTSLPGPYEMEKVALDPENGLLAGLAPGSAYFDMTTNSPGVVQRVAEAFQAMGVDLMDSPVSQRPPNMTIMAGWKTRNLRQVQACTGCHGAECLLCRRKHQGLRGQAGGPNIWATPTSSPPPRASSWR